MPDEHEISIREASTADYLLLAAIQEQASVGALAHIFPVDAYPFPAESVRDRWRTFPGRIFLAIREGRPAGLVGVVPPSLEGLYVVPEAWGTGVAAALHDTALGAIRDAGALEAQLWVLEHNARARHFYERRDWREDGRSRIVEYPPHPTDLGYALSLDRAPDAGLPVRAHVRSKDPAA